MRTPAGFECKYFYGNYFRGRNQEECRLIGNVPPPGNWDRKICKSCPVPGILRANECQSMVLHAHVKRTLGFLNKRVEISAFCTKSNLKVDEPQIGCGLCHPLPPDITTSAK